MDINRLNKDLSILQEEYNEKDYLGRVKKRNVTWKNCKNGTYKVYVDKIKLPSNANKKTTRVRIDVPANIYDPAGKDRRYFYQNIWIDPEIKVKHPKKQGWFHLPRLFNNQVGLNSRIDEDGLAFLCIHPNTISGEENILFFIQTMKVFIKTVNPDSW